MNPKSLSAEKLYFRREIRELLEKRKKAKKVFEIEHLKPNPFLVTQKKMQRQMFNLKYMITWHSCFIYTLKQIWVSKSIHYEIMIYWKPDRQGICSDHRSFNILPIFFLSGLWFYTFFIITRESCDHDIIITFLFKTQKCWYHWKDIRFFSTQPQWCLWCLIRASNAV